MALIKCKACGADISRQAPHCPSCGHPNKEANYLSGGQVLAGLALAGVAIWWMASHDGDSGVSAAPLAEDSVQLENVAWQKGGFGTVMLLNATLKNTGARAVKDVVIECIHSGESGTKIDQSKETVFKVIPAGKSVTVKDFNMGFVHTQAARASCRVVGASFS